MRSSRFSVFAVAALIAAGAAAHSAATAVTEAVAATYRTFRRGLETGISMLATPQVGVIAPTKPRVVLVAAREFLAKQMQRSRPTVTTRWRMCPSA